MKKLAIATFFACAFAGNVHAQSCPLCEQHREYNRNHPENNYEYYDDYLKEHKEAGKPEKKESAPAKQAPAASQNATKK